MIQKCNYLRVLEIFFKEPTKIHFIREIGKKISLAQTSVRNYINEMEKEGLIIKKESKPFDGFVSNRENEDFISLKQAYNLYSLNNLKKVLIHNLGPKAIIFFGSYQKGEDIENSDIDLLVVSRIKKDINFGKYEGNIMRKIHITFVKDINNLGENLKSNIKNGWILYGRI
ncbi:MAG: nucleotidyltransferase domain-containing protein [Nanoarchaeota archaeon]|mgnify:CR=1 FL=1